MNKLVESAGALVTALTLVLSLPFGKHPVANKLFVSGRIDGYETLIGCKLPGLINYIACREGAAVKRGQVLVELEAADTRAQLKQAQAQAEAALASAGSYRDLETSIEQQIDEAKQSKQQSSEESSGTITQAQHTQEALQRDVEAAKADVAAAESEAKLAKLTASRYTSLAVAGAVSQETADNAETVSRSRADVLESKRQALQSARQRLSAAIGATKTAMASRLTPEQRAKKVAQLESQLRQTKQLEIAAVATAKQADAKQEELRATLSYLTIRSPIDGLVTARSAEPGAYVAAGQTILTLIDPKNIFLRAFIADADIGRVRIGQAASIYLDSDPKRPIAGHVIEIDPEASFTPENIYFKKDRVKQVFGAKIAVDDPAGYAKIGMPADAEIHLDSPKK
jgi:HlyD family secretion protein